jgi:hypothetical protein
MKRWLNLTRFAGFRDRHRPERHGRGDRGAITRPYAPAIRPNEVLCTAYIARRERVSHSEGTEALPKWVATASLAAIRQLLFVD